MHCGILLTARFSLQISLYLLVKQKGDFEVPQIIVTMAHATQPSDCVTVQSYSGVLPYMAYMGVCRPNYQQDEICLSSKHE